jgi:phage-related minor tail protein
MASTTSSVDVDAMNESEFLAFVTRELKELGRDLKRATELLRDSNNSLEASVDSLEAAYGIKPPRHLSLVGEEKDDDA